MSAIAVRSALLLALLPAVVAPPTRAADWPTWGHDASRNMVSEETGLPDGFVPGSFKGDSEEIDLSTTKNVRWVAKLGSQSYGNPTVAGGRVFVGTNNETPRDPKHKGDRGVMMCLDEKTGKLLWQLVVPKLGTGPASDWELLGICSPPTVEGDRVYLVTNRCEVVCLDVNGMANGNDGPFVDEAQYMAGPGKPPIQPGPTDADILWRFDMRQELGVQPHNITSSSILIAGDALAVNTSNGVNVNHTAVTNPKAPELILLDKATGKLLAREASGISARAFHGSWSSPALAKVGEQSTIVLGGPDGFCYGFDPLPVPAAAGPPALKELWRCDCNPPSYRTKAGKPLKYKTPEGPSEVIATPVVSGGRIYATIGQDPEYGDGAGALVCINPSGAGNISKQGVVWSYTKISRSLSTPSVADGLVYVGDYKGILHCVDAATGKPLWVYDTKSRIWGSTLVADGKVYLGTEDGDLIILQAGKVLKEIRKVDMRSPIYSSPVAAGGTVYVATPTHLYALGKLN